jgi:hypothetical protein
MSTKWRKINTEDISTYPPLGKQVVWRRTVRNYHTVLASLKQDENGDYYADGAYITNDDYWYLLPKLNLS